MLLRLMMVTASRQPDHWKSEKKRNGDQHAFRNAVVATLFREELIPRHENCRGYIDTDEPSYRRHPPFVSIVNLDRQQKREQRADAQSGGETEVPHVNWCRFAGGRRFVVVVRVIVVVVTMIVFRHLGIC